MSIKYKVKALLRDLASNYIVKKKEKSEIEKFRDTRRKLIYDSVK